MARILLPHGGAAGMPPGRPYRPERQGCDPVAPARGIAGALAISALFWLALALLLPLVL